MGERDLNMSCDIVSDLTISAIVCAMAGTEYGAAGLHDETPMPITTAMD